MRVPSVYPPYTMRVPCVYPPYTLRIPSVYLAYTMGVCVKICAKRDGKNDSADAFGGRMYPTKQTDPFYTSARWLRVRARALARDHGICQICLAAFRAGYMLRPRKATIVHHIIPRTERPDLELDLDNLQSVCATHHNREHPEKGGSRGADMTDKARPQAAARIIKI